MGSYPSGRGPLCPVCGLERLRDRDSRQCGKCHHHPGWHTQTDPGVVPSGYEKAWAHWQAYIGQSREHYAGPAKRPVKLGRQRIVIASDLHIPFQDSATVADLLVQEAQADTAVIAGDVHDFYSISRFIKYESVPIEQELAETTLFLEQASQTWPRVILLEGNHGTRLEKQLRSLLPADTVKVIQFLSGGTLSPLRAIARRFRNVEVASTPVDRFEIEWFVQINDLIVAHAEKFSKVPASALRQMAEWFADQHDALGLQPWNVLVQAHTHQLGKFPWYANKTLLECGCLCRLHGYQIEPKMKGRPQRRGWVTLEQVDGVTDVNTADYYWVDRALPKMA
jgi:hypothetical protein